MGSLLLAFILTASALGLQAPVEAPPADTSLEDLTRAGASPYRPMERPASLSVKVISALKHPDADRPCCGGSNGPDYEESHRQVETTAPAGELLADYAAQLAQAGWTSSLTHHDGPIALQTWQFSSADGQRWHALLLIEESAARPTNRRLLTLRLTRISSAPQ